MNKYFLDGTLAHKS